MSDRHFMSQKADKPYIEPIVYKSGYKYQLAKNIVFDLGDDFRKMWDTGRTHMQGDYLLLSNDGRITICAGYAWDGASCAPDWNSIRRGALMHDACYQLVRHGVLPDFARLIIDRRFREMCIEDGMPKALAAIVYRAVRVFGYKAAVPGEARKLHASPK